MFHRILSLLTISFVTFSLSAAVVTTGNGKISFQEQVPTVGCVSITFNKCMANDLFTFSKVMLDSVLVNRTESDNIGPFGLETGWTGGNHLNHQQPSARTDSVTVWADGSLLSPDRPRTVVCRQLRVSVTNTLLLPADTVPFAVERIDYLVSGNSIEVTAHHRCVAPQAVLVDRYYGMQSMFIDETEMLTPGGAYAQWTPIDSVSEFSHVSAPCFCTFVEHSARGYQACWLDPTFGLGNRHLVDADDVVFIGHSWGKSYHKTIGRKTLHPGDTTSWHGVYSWFRTPLVDRCRKKAGRFSYLGWLGGKAMVFTTDSKGRMTMKPASKYNL